MRRLFSCNLVVLLLLFIPLVISAQDTGQTRQERHILEGKWSTRLAPTNQNYIEAYVDTSEFQKYECVDNARFEVHFFDDSNHKIGSQTFNFTDRKLKALVKRQPNSPYIRYFRHQFSNVRRVEAGILSYNDRACGMLPGKAGSPLSLIRAIPKAIVGIFKKESKEEEDETIEVNGEKVRINEKGALIIDPPPSSNKLK